MALIGNLYNKAINGDNKNIFCYGLDWRFQKMLEECMPDYNFYGDANSFIFKNYDNNDNIANFYNSKRIPKFRNISLIIINDESQYEHCRKYSFNHHIPILFFNHSGFEYKIDNVEIIDNPPYFIEVPEISDKKYSNVISGDFAKESINVIEDICGLIETEVVGNLKKVKYKEYKELLNKNLIYSYLSDNTYNRIDLLDAMASGSVVISNDSDLCKNFIKHMETGLISDSIQSYEKYITEILSNRELVEHLSRNAREYIKKNYNDKSKLRIIIEEASKKYYTRIGK